MYGTKDWNNEEDGYYPTKGNYCEKQLTVVEAAVKSFTTLQTKCVVEKQK